MDSSGNVAIAGTSTSVDYPVTDGSKLTVGINGTPVNDAAVTEIDPTGSKLIYSTLFGGNGNEASASAGEIAMDSAGDIYIAMDTVSTNLTVAPVTPQSPFQPVYGATNGSADGFFAIFVPVVTNATGPASHLTTRSVQVTLTVQ